MSVLQSNLCYAKDALEPHISKLSLTINYERHHREYVNTLNAMIADTDLSQMSLEQVMRSALETGNEALFQVAAEVWNFGFLWQCLSPDGDGRPRGTLKDMILGDFGSIDRFRQCFCDAATSSELIAWAWLLAERGQLRIGVGARGESPTETQGCTPLMILNVAERTYGHDYPGQPRRYIDTCLRNLVDWRFVEMRADNAQYAAAA